MLGRWHRWLIGTGLFLIAVATAGTWWYHDRSDLEAAITGAERLGLPVAPELVVRSPERQRALTALRGLDVATAVYDTDGYGPYPNLEGWPEEHTAFLAHWRELPVQRIAAVDAAIDAVGSGPLWPTATEGGSDVWLGTWHHQATL